MPAQLIALKNVAALDSQIFQLEENARQIPQLISEAEHNVRRARQRVDAAEADTKAARVKAELKERELQDAEQAVIKLRNQINQAKSNKEFQALQHEILAKEADNTRLEDTVLAQMQSIDRQVEERKAAAAELKEAEAALAGVRARLDEESEEISAKIGKLAAERSAAGKDVPSEIFAKYQRLISRRGQTAMVAVVNGSCQGCFMQMRPETMAQLKKGSDLVTCHSCGRILYLEE